MNQKPTPKDISFLEFDIYVKIYGFQLDRVNGSHFTFINKKSKISITIATHNNYVKPFYIMEFNKRIKIWGLKND